MISGDSDGVADEAAMGWLVRMRGEDRDQLRGDFEAWLEASPRNRAAYERAERLLGQSAILKGSARYGENRARAPLRLAADASRSPGARRWLVAGAMAAAAAMLFVAFNAGGATLSGPHGNNPMAAWAAEPLVTRHGEIRRLHLDDGSVATLDTDTRLEVAMTSEARLVRLVRGRARLQIAGDARPFRIEAGKGVVTASEAMLDIERASDGTVAVTLASGAAGIEPAAGRWNAAGPLQLVASQSIAYRADDQALAIERQAASSAMTDWPSGWAEYRVVRVDQLVAQANRYAAVPIVIADPRIAGLEVSGRFRISETESFVDRLSRLLGLQAERRPDSIRLRSR